jgi:hypothetical protein
MPAARKIPTAVSLSVIQINRGLCGGFSGTCGAADDFVDIRRLFWLSVAKNRANGNQFKLGSEKWMEQAHTARSNTTRALLSARSGSQKAIKFAIGRAAVESNVPPGTRVQLREPASRVATPTMQLRRTKNQSRESTSVVLADPLAVRVEVRASHRLDGNNNLNHHSSCNSSARTSRSTASDSRHLGQRNCVLPVRTANRLLETAQTARGVWLRVAAVYTV